MAVLGGCSSIPTTPTPPVLHNPLRLAAFAVPKGCQTYLSRLSIRHRLPPCQAAAKDKVESARTMQLQATELLAELMKTENPELVAKQHVDSLTQDFFMVASTYLAMAKKEGNVEVVNRLESTLRTAMAVREKTLRPEIQLLNQLLRDDGASERAKTMKKGSDYLRSDSYFFQLLNRMIMDVEKQPNNPSNPEKSKLLSQLRAINKEAREISKGSKGFKQVVKE